MLLAIDIGNTNINFGVFKGKRLRERFSISTKDYNLKKLKKLLGRAKIDDVVICSVVPVATKILGKDLKRLLGKPPYNIGKEIKVPVRNLYRRPNR